MKNQIEVPNHVRKTLQELDAEVKVRQGEIQQLLQCRSSLMELYGVPASLPMGNVVDQAEPRLGNGTGAPKRGRPRAAKSAPGEKAQIAVPPPVRMLQRSGRLEAACRATA